MISFIYFSIFLFLFRSISFTIISIFTNQRLSTLCVSASVQHTINIGVYRCVSHKDRNYFPPLALLSTRLFSSFYILQRRPPRREMLFRFAGARSRKVKEMQARGLFLLENMLRDVLTRSLPGKKDARECNRGGFFFSC